MTDSKPSPPNPSGSGREQASDGGREQNEFAQRPKDPPNQRSGPRDSPSGLAERQALLRLASAGFELASFALILGAAGYGVDHWLGNATPYAGIAGVMLGFCLGFYRLVVLANRLGS